eukprot:1151097-Pelagomonas_calceolata.AAC.2
MLSTSPHNGQRAQVEDILNLMACFLPLKKAVAALPSSLRSSLQLDAGASAASPLWTAVFQLSQSSKCGSRSAHSLYSVSCRSALQSADCG